MTFERYIGIDYSGAATPETGLTGLRVYVAAPGSPPAEVRPPAGGKRHWDRRGIARWLVERLADDQASLVGIDHAFSFPLAYFERHRLPLEWPVFLHDFASHWPTDGAGVRVEDLRRDGRAPAAARGGDSRWRRLTELRAGSAKSVFHFDVPGSVAKSTHAGLPWLLHLRRRAGRRVRVWPFDGFAIPRGVSAVAEVYPSLWSRGFDRAARSADQHDAYSVAAWLRQADRDGRLAQALAPPTDPADRALARVEGWILGVR